MESSFILSVIRRTESGEPGDSIVGALVAGVLILILPTVVLLLVPGSFWMSSTWFPVFVSRDSAVMPVISILWSVLRSTSSRVCWSGPERSSTHPPGKMLRTPVILDASSTLAGVARVTVAARPSLGLLGS